MPEKCIVARCPNHKHEGTFVGDLCAPCHTMLVNGEPRYGKTFVHQMRDRIEALEAERDALKANLEAAVDQMQRVKDFRYDPNIGIELNMLEATLKELKEGELND